MDNEIDDIIDLINAGSDGRAMTKVNEVVDYMKKQGDLTYQDIEKVGDMISAGSIGLALTTLRKYNTRPC